MRNYGVFGGYSDTILYAKNLKATLAHREEIQKPTPYNVFDRLVITGVPAYCGGSLLSHLDSWTFPETETDFSPAKWGFTDQSLNVQQLANINDSSEFEGEVLAWLAANRLRRGHVFWFDRVGGMFDKYWKLPEGEITKGRLTFEKVKGPVNINHNSGSRCYQTTYLYSSITQLGWK